MSSCFPNLCRSCAAIGLTLAVLCIQAAAQEFSVNAELTAVDGTPGPFQPHQTVNVRLKYFEAGSTELTETKLEPRAWFRIRQKGELPCSTLVNVEYGQSSVNIVGYVIASLNSDNTLSFIDPLKDVATANMISVTSLPEKPSALHVYAGEVLVTLPQTGVVMAISPSGGKRLIAESLKQLTDMEIVGSAFAISDGNILRILDEQGHPLSEIEMPETITGLQSSGEKGSAVSARSYLVALGESNTLYGVDAETGRILWQQQSSAQFDKDLDSVSTASAMLVPDVKAPGVSVRYWNQPTRELNLSTGFRVERSVSSKSREFAFVWSNEAMRAAVIDVRVPKVVHEMALSKPLSQALFSGWNLYLAHRNDADVDVLDTGVLAQSQGVSMTTLPIESEENSTTRLSTFADDGQILALMASGTVVRTYGDGQSTQPKAFTNIKGAPSVQVALVDRRFRQEEDGVYSVIVRMPANGPVQLVTTSGLGGSQQCFQVASTAPSLPIKPALEVEAVDFVAGAELQRRFTITGDLPDGLELSNLIRLEAKLLGEKYRWKKAFSARLQEDGSYFARIKFPIPGQYTLLLPDYVAIDPLQVEAR